MDSKPKRTFPTTLAGKVLFLYIPIDFFYKNDIQISDAF